MEFLIYIYLKVFIYLQTLKDSLFLTQQNGFSGSKLVKLEF